MVKVFCPYSSSGCEHYQYYRITAESAERNVIQFDDIERVKHYSCLALPEDARCSHLILLNQLSMLTRA